MADKDKQPAPEKAPAQDAAFRRQVATAIATAFVTRHGGLGSAAEREANARMIWSFADALLAAEHLPPLPSPPEHRDIFRGIVPERRRRAAHPADEWAVQAGDRVTKGFATHEEAEDYARGRPDAAIVQVSGPGVDQLLVAPETA